MKAVLSGYFDIGFGVGIDDFSFAGQKMAGLPLPQGFVVEQLAVASPFMQSNVLNVRLGKGLAFDFTHSSEFEGWKNDAFRLRTSVEFMDDYYMSEEGREQLRCIPVERVEYSAHLTIYSCGIGCVEVVFDGLPDNPPVAESSVRFIQTFEAAAYGMFGSHSGFQVAFLDKCQAVLRYFIDEKNLAAQQSMLRPLEKDEHFNFNFFPSFTLLFFTNGQPDADTIKAFFCKTCTEFTVLPLDGADVLCSWYVFIEPLSDMKDSDTLASLIRIYNLFYGICQAHNILLARKISGLFFNMAEAGSAELDHLIKLRITSHVFTNYTDVSNICQNEEILNVFGLLNRQGQLPAIHQGIRNNIEILNSIQNQIDQSAEKEKEAHQQRQEGRLNKFIAIITTLTFVSVLTDFLDLDDRSRLIVPYLALRLVLYALILGAIFWFLFFSFKEKNSKS